MWGNALFVILLQLEKYSNHRESKGVYAYIHLPHVSVYFPFAFVRVNLMILSCFCPALVDQQSTSSVPNVQTSENLSLVTTPHQSSECQQYREDRTAQWGIQQLVHLYWDTSTSCDVCLIPIKNGKGRKANSLNSELSLSRYLSNTFSRGTL